MQVQAACGSLAGTEDFLFRELWSFIDPGDDRRRGKPVESPSAQGCIVCSLQFKIRLAQYVRSDARRARMFVLALRLFSFVIRAVVVH